jgi:penicillin-binding protein-related factor A (putative recombinase)
VSGNIFRSRSRTQPEKLIENAILEYLAARDIFAFKVKTSGTYDPVIKGFRKPGKYYLKGVSDILGLYQGRFLAIEVKTKTGRLSPVQKLFLERVKSYGGIAFVARSVEDVGVELGNAG